VAADQHVQLPQAFSSTAQHSTVQACRRPPAEASGTGHAAVAVAAHEHVFGGLCCCRCCCHPPARTAATLTQSSPHCLPMFLQGEADSALDHLWAKKRAEIGQ